MNGSNISPRDVYNYLVEATEDSYAAGEYNENEDPFYKVLESRNIAELEPLFQQQIEPDITTLYTLIEMFPSMRDLIMDRYHTLCDVQDDEGNTLIHLAAKNNDPKLLIFFANHDTPLDAVDCDGRNALHVAALHNSADFIAQFLELQYTLINLPCEQLESTPLHYALEYKNYDAAEMLINHHADIHARNIEEMTALHLAIKHNLPSIIELLLENENTQVNAVDEKEKTPLHYAAKTGNLQAVKALITRRANHMAQDSKGNTPLHIAIKNEKINTAKQLVSLGALLTIANNDGLCPQELKEAQGREDIFSHALYKNSGVQSPATESCADHPNTLSHPQFAEEHQEERTK